MTVQDPMAGDSWNPTSALMTALEQIELEGGRMESAQHDPPGVDVLLVPPSRSPGSLIFITAVEDEIHISAGAGGGLTVNNETDDDMEHFIDVIEALIGGGGADLVRHDSVYGFEPRLAVKGRTFSSRPTDATFVRRIPAW